jgi:hypothetical protein
MAGRVQERAMSTATIDHASLARLVQAGAVGSTHVTMRDGGWAVVVHALRDGVSGTAYTLATHRKAPRLFKKMDSLVSYLADIGISRFDVDAAGFAHGDIRTWSRPDRAAALKQTHEDAAHDRWFREQVEASLHLADSPDAEWISHEDVKARRAKRRAEIRAELAG